MEEDLSPGDIQRMESYANALWNYELEPTQHGYKITLVRSWVRGVPKRGYWFRFTLRGAKKKGYREMYKTDMREAAISRKYEAN